VSDTSGIPQRHDWRIRSDCRLCSAQIGIEHTVLDLAPTPPANEFIDPRNPGDQGQELIPLYLARCPDCGHVQLPVVVDPVALFRNYVYVSGTSPSFVEHFRRYAEAAVEAHDLRADDLVVEIGSNDGTLLKHFRALGMSVLGVDPAEKIALEANAAGIPTLVDFFNRKTAHAVRWSNVRRPSLIVANNVFAHADDLRDIALGVRDILEPKGGRFIFEVQYLVDLVNKTLFDMVYHEHLSYHALGPLIRFFDSCGMTLVDAQRFDVHGGSIRCTVAPTKGGDQSDRLKLLLEHEVKMLNLSVDPWGDMRRRIDDAGEKLRAFIDSQRHLPTWPVVGYGAPAKLTTLCHQFGITLSDIRFVVDDSPWKQGLLAPGTRIPVVAPSQFVLHDAPVVIFAWNFAAPIAQKLRRAGYTGRIVAPLPEFKELP
jgi:SAM-dependent methyltransferase